MKYRIIATVAATLFAALFVHCAAAGPSSFELWKAHVAAGESPEAAALVDRLRKRGPDALDELLAERNRLSSRLNAAAADPEIEILPEQIAELDQFIDAVGGQRYCSTSRLFWHTNLDRARQASRETGKPILSLRLLGNLTDELSCANSRFFRTTLYANGNISDYMREHFVLHWESVRPAPVMTIDFGDGRRIIRTVTGNSVHYVLDSAGRPLDALPGLYGPQAFQNWLQRAHDLGTAIDRAVSLDERSSILSSYHEARLIAIRRQWQHDLEQVELVAKTTTSPGKRAEGNRVPAEAATAIAMPKAAVEVKPIAMITMTRRDMAELTTGSVWRDIARLHADEAELDETSRRLIYSEIPQALRSDLVAMTKSGVERRSLVSLFSSLRSSTALDSVRNEYELHSQIHEWFLSGEVGSNVSALNSRVYAELFLTPQTDPWLGLFDPTAYTGLTDAGIVKGVE